MRFSKKIILFLIIGFISIACSKLQDDIVLPSSVSVHGASNILLPSSSSFHGLTVKQKGLESCKQCHASKFNGGTANVNCATAICHPYIDVHQSNINLKTSPNFHGKYIANAKITMNKCNQCHGDNYEGQIASPACTKCHTDIAMHKDGISTVSSPNFHGKYIAGKNWNMSGCTSCHGSNYNGSIAAPTCNNCHKNSGGPEACNTCHGDFSNPLLTAPPRSLANGTATTDPTVGAHANHLRNTKIGAAVACNECHIVPAALGSTGHLDSTPKAEVIFGTLSNTGKVTSTYIADKFTCTNTYCHGNFTFTKATSQYPDYYAADKITGSNFTPKWNVVDGTQSKCGTCHGLPPTGHVESSLKACTICHQGIVDAKGNIIDTKRHMDGKVNVFGN